MVICFNWVGSTTQLTTVDGSEKSHSQPPFGWCWNPANNGLKPSETTHHLGFFSTCVLPILWGLPTASRCMWRWRFHHSWCTTSPWPRRQEFWVKKMLDLYGFVWIVHMMYICMDLYGWCMWFMFVLQFVVQLVRIVDGFCICFCWYSLESLT